MKHTRLTATVLVALLVGGLGAGVSSAQEVSQQVPIITGPGADVVEKVAAREVASYLKRLYPDHDFPVGDRRPTAGPEILVGTPAKWPHLASYVPHKDFVSAESFRITASGKTGVIAGADPRGVLFGVYALLEKLGCGFWLSSESVPEPKSAPFDFSSWTLEDRPLFADRIVFDWHNFLSSASSWELEDWQQYISQAAKMRFNTIMVHAYGNNPMFTFTHNGQTKPMGYAATTRSGRDWGTQHVNDVRRLVGGEVFAGPVFGSSIGLAPEDRRGTAAVELMQNVFAYARGRGLHVTFALDVDTESANPQNVIRTLPASARLQSSMGVPPMKDTGKVPVPRGDFELANPDTPEGFAYYQAQVRQLLETYPQIDRLAMWFRTDRTPWRNLKPEQFPPNWRAEFEAALEKDPWLRDDAHASGMFVMGKLLRTFQRVLRELGRTDVELAAGSWRLHFLRAADHFFPREVPLIPLDWETVFDNEKGQQQLRQVRPGRRLIPIVWAHHDDRTYIGRPYKPFERFGSQLRANGGTGFGIIHWTTRPLDLYFKSLSEQVWQATADRPLAETCADFATRAFGGATRKTGGAYLLAWLNGAPMFGRETSNRFMDVPLTDYEGNMRRFDERLSLLAQIDASSLSSQGLNRLAYYRDYEQFMRGFYESHAALDRAAQLLKKGERESARDALGQCRPEEVIRAYVQAAQRDRITRGEQALIVSLNLRWLPYAVSLRQALGLEPVRIKFLPTQHEPLAQGAGTNTFYLDTEHQLWKGLGEKETGCPTFRLPDAADTDEFRRSGLRIDKPVTLRLGTVAGDRLMPGRYSVKLMLTEPPVKEVAGTAELELRGSGAVAGPARGTLDDRSLHPSYEVAITDGQLDLNIRPSRGTVFVSGVVITPGEGDGQTVFPGREWMEATPESQDVDAAKLKAAVAYMDANFGPDGAKELVIVRNGYLIHKGPDCDAYHNAWSCTKTFTSTVLGVLAADGECALDDLAVKHLPELDDQYPAYARIRLRHLASMSSGYKGQVVNVTAQQPWGKPGSYLVPTAPLFEPGAHVQYHDHQVFLLGRLLTRLAGESEQSVFKQRIADPIGMTRWDWGISGKVDGIDLNNAAGTPTTPGLQTTARQMARFGHLYLNRGAWNGRQLLPASFVDEATRNQVPGVGASSFLHGRYGFYWWTNDVKPDGKRPWPSAPPRTYTSHGHSANFCYVIPEWNMVIVRMGTQPIASGVRGISEIEAKWDTFFAKLAAGIGDGRDRSAPRTRVSIRAGRWFLNDEVTYRGTRAEGLLMNVRMVNAVFEDANRPEFDPEANTSEFITQIPDYMAQGVRAFTLCLQGGFPGYEGAVNSAFGPDGSLRDSYLRRVRRVIETCDRGGAVVILGCYYQRQDQVLKDEAAVRTGVVNVAKWVSESGFTNVVLEIANEFDHSGFDYRLLKTPKGMAELIGLAKQTAPALLVSASGLGHGRLPDEVARASDFLLIHFNGTRVDDIPGRIAALRKYDKPIVCNEDEKIGKVGARACELCVENGASWGFMHVEVNQRHPFTFQGAADDPEVFAAIRRLTSASVRGIGFQPMNHRQDADATNSMKDTGKPALSAANGMPVPRLLIETDAGGDPDDEQSLVRFLLYANEWDIEGIIANRPATRRPENKNPEDTGLGIVRRLLDAYGQCRPNLVQHDARYPTKEFLWQRTVAGYNDTNDGVNLIIAVVDKDDPRPLWYSDWGTDNGAAVNNLKLALDRVLRERGPEGYARFKSKLRLSSYDKFGEHTTNIAPPFAIWVDTFQPPVEGKRWYHRFSALTSQAGGFDLKRDVLTGHGPLGELYPTNTTHWAKEGDTMTFLYLVPTGMNDPNEPSWGSWAGRYGLNEKFSGKRYYWASPTDTWNGATSRDNTLARWAADLQNDFRARLNWCVKSPREANHAPHAVVNGSEGKEILHITARPGQDVSFDAGASRDPDGDKLAYEWFIYREAGTYQGEVSLTDASVARALLHIPTDAAGKTIHVVLVVRDEGAPPLTGYRRVVVHVSPESQVRSVPVRAYQETPHGVTTNEYFPPPESQGGWRKLDTPEDTRKIAGVDPAKLDELKQWLLQSDKRNFAAVVIRRGYIVLEVKRGNSAKTDSRRVASVSKAVCATVLAIASEQSQRGLTPKKMAFDDPAFQFIPWAQPLSDPRKAQITIKQLLNHTSGLCPEAIGAPNDGTWEYVLGHSGDPRTAKLAFDPGTACGYSTHALDHASLVCETVTGKPYDQFAIEALFKPLGIEHWWFQYSEGGEKIGRHPTHGLGMPARDLARVAYCMLHEGRWGGRQVIPKWFVDQTGSSSHNVRTPEMRWKLNPQTFTLGWELPALRGDGTGPPNAEFRVGDPIPADARYKPGSGGQLIAFVPSLDLVITRQTGSSGEWAYEEYVRRACAAVPTDSEKKEK